MNPCETIAGNIRLNILLSSCPRQGLAAIYAPFAGLCRNDGRQQSRLRFGRRGPAP
jgi:hypothetical protein